MNTTTDRMTVSDAMHHGVVTCQLDTPLSKVAQMMVGHRIHCVVVNSGEDEGMHFWSAVSDRDLTAAFAHGDVDATAGAIAATPAVTIAVREPLRRAAQLLTEHGVTHLVVLDGPGTRPVGVLSTLDVARVLADG